MTRANVIVLALGAALAIAAGASVYLAIQLASQTAAALGCSTGTVKSQTSYAIAALRRLLPNYVPGGTDAP